jgi:hypothetical protein
MAGKEKMLEDSCDLWHNSVVFDGRVIYGPHVRRFCMTTMEEYELRL